LLKTAWPYVLLFGATAGVLLAQEAFRAARLDWSLPPTAAVQPLAGVALGVGVLSDHLSTSPGGLAVEALSIVVGIAGVVVIGHRMRAMRHHWAASIRASRKPKHAVAMAEDFLAWERREHAATR
jgi:hypothetical protein